MSLGSILTFLCLALVQNQDKVELEIVVERGVIGTQHEWMQRLGRVGADRIKMNSGASPDSVKITETKIGSSTTYKVTGVLTTENRLILPGGTYSVSQVGTIKAWVSKLKNTGLKEEDNSKRKTAFGLNAQELVGLHGALSAKVKQDTKGVSIKDVVAQIEAAVTLSITFDRSATTALAGDELVKEELKGVSCGTALANCIRPLGLVVVPKKTGGRMVLSVVDSRAAKEHWPIGWPLQKIPRETAPKLFKFLEVEIKDTPLNETLDAVESKLGIPFLYDQNLLAKHEIELDKVNVTIPAGRTSYYQLLRRASAQAKPRVKHELRVDEAGQPFIWLSTWKK